MAKRKTEVPEEAQALDLESLETGGDSLTLDLEGLQQNEAEEVLAETQPVARPKKIEQIGAYWYGYNREGLLLSRSRDQATVLKAIREHGGWD